MASCFYTIVEFGVLQLAATTGSSSWILADSEGILKSLAFKIKYFLKSSESWLTRVMLVPVVMLVILQHLTAASPVASLRPTRTHTDHL